MTFIKRNLPMAEYLASPGVSKHDLDLFSECPEKYAAKASGLLKSAQTPAMEFGSSVHAAVFESRRIYSVRPETYRNDNGEVKPWNGNATVCREWMADHEGTMILTAAEDAKIDAICRAVRRDSRAAHLIAQGEAEVSLYATDPETGIALRGRPDFIVGGGIGVVDLKTTADASTDAFSREIHNRRYHVQAAFYFRLMRANGFDPAAFYFLVVENGPLPLLNVRKLSQSAIAYADEIISEELEAMANCIATGVWPGYSGPGESIEEIAIPDYAYKLQTIDVIN